MNTAPPSATHALRTSPPGHPAPPHRVTTPTSPNLCVRAGHASSRRHSLCPMPDTPQPHTCDIGVESETFIDVSDRNPTEGPRAVTDSQSLNPRPRPHTPPSRVCDIVGLSTLVPLRGHSDGPQMCDRMGQSETFADVSYPNLNREPRGSIESRSTVHYSLRPMSDTLPSKICDNTGQSETFADSPTPNTPASPAHRPATDLQLLTSNSQLLTSTSLPRQAPSPKTYEICVESETFIDVSDRNPREELREGAESRSPNARSPAPGLWPHADVLPMCDIVGLLILEPLRRRSAGHHLARRVACHYHVVAGPGTLRREPSGNTQHA